MVARAKYLFDQDFGAGAKAADKPIAVAELAIRLGEAESKGFRDGFAAAEKEGAAVAARRNAAAFERIGDTLDQLSQALAALEERLKAEAVEIAAAIARKLAPELVLREPFAEIAALATECFHHLVATPHVAVRVGSAIYDTAKTKIGEIALARGFEGRLAVVPDETLAPGDCRIEWADGGVIRDQAATVSAIDEMVSRYISARTAPAL